MTRDQPARVPPEQPDTGVGPERGFGAGPPRWVTVLGVVVVVLVILMLVVLHLTGALGPGAH